MEKRIGILRGINVGGKRKILMADLKVLFSNIGLTNPVSYIQSGNIIFESDDNLRNTEISDLIEKEIANKYGFDVPVIVLLANEIKQSVANNPYYTTDADIKQLHLTFLKETPTQQNLDSLQASPIENDTFEIMERNIFIKCEGKYHESKLTNNFFEKKLKTTATTRNWKTVLKLLELSKD